MAQDKSLLRDDERRIQQYESVKDVARNEVRTEVSRQADQSTTDEMSEIQNLGSDLKQEAISEVKGTKTEVKTARRAARFSQIIDYLFYLIYGLIGLQIIFDLFGARRSNGFRNFIDVLSSPLLAPFKNLFPDPAAGRFQIRFSYLAALLIYLMLHFAVNGILRVIAHRKTAI